MICNGCKVAKVESDFYFKDKGNNIRHKICKECQKHKSKSNYNDNKVKSKSKTYRWNEDNLIRRRAIAKNSYQLNKKRFPAIPCECCSKGDILDYYTDCPQGYEVDHINPTFLGGLHCLKNFQYLSKSDHARKSFEERKLAKRLGMVY